MSVDHIVDHELAMSMSLESSGSSSSSSAGGGVHGTQEEWKCSQCTFDNTSSDSYCYMCGSPSSGLSVAFAVGIHAGDPPTCHYYIL